MTNSFFQTEWIDGQRWFLSNHLFDWAFFSTVLFFGYDWIYSHVMTAVVIGLRSNGLCLHLKSLFPFFICFFPLQIFQISTPLKNQCRCSPFLFLCVFVECDILLKQRQLPRCPFHLSGPHWFIVHFRFHSENAGFLSLILFGNLWIMEVAGCSLSLYLTFCLFV